MLHLTWPARHSLLAVLLVVLLRPGWAGEDAQAGQGLTLPSEIDVPRLAEVVGEWVGVSVQFNPQKIGGTIRLDIRKPLDQAQAWSVFNQVLVQYGLTTVVAGDPVVYHIVPVGEAEAAGLVFSDPKMAAAISPPPGSLTIVQPLSNISPEAAIQALGSILGQRASAKAIGRTNGQVIVAGDRERVLAGLRVVAALDQPGSQVAFRTYQPRYAASSKLLAGLTAAWAAAAKVSGRPVTEEAQLMPDGQRILVVASAGEIGRSLELLADLDRAEPQQSITYRVDGFGIEDVAKLIEQTIIGSEDGRGRVVRDRLTNALVIQGTETQHERIRALIADLAKTPVESRVSMRHVVIRHRPAIDLAAVLRELAGQGANEAVPASPTAVNAATPATAVSIQPVAASTQAPSAARGQAAPAVGGVNGITVDPLTNTIVLIGQSRFIEQMMGLIDRLDRRQPQVQVEISMVILSDEDTRALGVEWAAVMRSGSNMFSIGQFLGLSESSSSGFLDRVPVAGNGLTSLLINPGDYSVMLQALSTVNHGRNVVTSQTVVDNNSEATVDAVVQQPIGNVNSNTNLATTSYGGTSDAGTKIKIKPSIGAADQVQLTFSVSQSVFVGESIKTEDGGVLPPPKRQDSLASVATVPDGHVIALGGLSNQTDRQSRSGLPWISEAPLVGALFRNETKSNQHSRFFLFLRADVMRSATYEDLKFRSRAPIREAGVGRGGPPELKPRFIE